MARSFVLLCVALATSPFADAWTCVSPPSPPLRARAFTTATRWLTAEGKGFGKIPSSPPPKKPPVDVIAEPSVVAEREDASDVDFPATSPESKRMLKELEARRDASKGGITQRIKALREVEVELKSNPTAGIIPDKVAARMLRRMLPLAAVPIFGGIGLFAFFYLSATRGGAEFQPTVVAYATTAPWLLGLFGLTYGLLSSSWDEDVEGSLLGTEEIKVNAGRILDGLRRGQDAADLREMEGKQGRRDDDSS